MFIYRKKIKNNYFIKFFLIQLLIFIWIFSGWPRIWNNPSIPPKISKAEAATQTYASGSGDWNSPVTGTITVEVWGGGGGGGGGGGSNKNGGGGGAGGQYAIKQVVVTKGTNYAYSVGSGGISSQNSNGQPGGDTTFNTNTVVAKGGAAGMQYSGSSGIGGTGSTSGGVGDTVYAGGNGANGTSSYGGGGGGGAGSTGTGNSGSGSTGGSAKTENGGTGGNGATSNSAGGSAGGNYGGGSGGATKNGASENGAGGYIRITYPDQSAPTTVPNTPNANDFGSDTTPTLEFTGTDANYEDDVRYNVQIDDSGDCLSPILDKVSGTDAGFVGTGSEPYTSGEIASYTVQVGEALSSGTYYWRARGIDPAGSNTYGSWTTIRSFTVTAATISITVEPGSGTVTYGIVATSKDTTGAENQTQTVRNSGSVAEDFDIKGQNSANWTLGASAGDATYKHEWCTSNCDSSPVWNAMTTTYDSNYLASNIATDTTVDFDLKVTVPTSNPGTNQQSVDVFVRATQH